jgi:ribosomal protein S3
MYRKLRRKWLSKINGIKLSFIAEMEGLGLDNKRVGIHKLTVVPLHKTIHLWIKVQRAGLLIGRKGETIKTIQANLENYYQKTVKIHLTEYDPFWSR